MKINKFGIFSFFIMAFLFFCLASVAFTADDRDKAPDLFASNIYGLEGNNLTIGETRTIVIEVGNFNLVAAKHVKVKYQIDNLAVEDTIPEHGFIKGEKAFADFPKEARFNFSVDYKAVYPASFRIGVWVDSNDTVWETEENNNYMEKIFTVEGELTPAMFFAGKDIDLRIEKKINFSNLEPPVGFSINFKTKVLNNSNIEVWGAHIDMLVNDETVDSQELGTIAASNQKEIVFSYAFPTTGTYKVKFIADSRNEIPERDEKNNTTDTVNVNVKSGVFGTGHKDVAVTSFTLSKNYCMQGEKVTAEATVKNIGQDTLNLILFTIGPAEARPVAAKVIPVLDPGKEEKINVAIPTLIAGDYAYEARLDGKNVIKEDNEENNVRTAYLQVEKITREHARAQAANVAIEKISQAIDAFSRWLGGLGKPKPQPEQPKP